MKGLIGYDRMVQLSYELVFFFYIHIFYLTIGSCFSVHYRVMEHAGSLESTKEE